jgi:hypothetical protein
MWTRPRLVVVDVTTNAAKTLARGRMHNVSVSADGRFIKFDQEQPGVPGQAVASYSALVATDVDTAYVAVNPASHLTQFCSLLLGVSPKISVEEHSKDLREFFREFLLTLFVSL